MKGTIQTLFGDVPEAQSCAWRWVEEQFEPIRALYQTASVTEIFVDRFDSISIEQNGVIKKTDCMFESEEALSSFITQLAITLNQKCSDEHPILDARLPDCSRLCCTLPVVSPQGATFTMRIAPKSHITIEQLVNFNALTTEMVEYLHQAIVDGKNMVISGNTGSGKTTLVRALAKFIPSEERLVTCEDTQELYIDWLPYRVSLEASNKAGSNVEMQDLIYASLRMRPDRIWVGEIRKPPAADAFVQAINTGHTGCVTTIHANNGADALTRLQYLIAAAGNVSYELARKQVTDNVDIIIHASRHADYGRKITEISEVKENRTVHVFEFDRETLIHNKCQDRQ